MVVSVSLLAVIGVEKLCEMYRCVRRWVGGELTHLDVAAETIGEDKRSGGVAQRGGEGLLSDGHAGFVVVSLEAEIARNATAPGGLANSADTDRLQSAALGLGTEYGVFVAVGLHSHRVRDGMLWRPAVSRLCGDLLGEAADPGGDAACGDGVHEFWQVFAECGGATRFGDDDRPVGAVVECPGGPLELLLRLRQLPGRDPGQTAAQVGADFGAVAGILDDAPGCGRDLGAEAFGEAVDDQDDVAVGWCGSVGAE